MDSLAEKLGRETFRNTENYFLYPQAVVAGLPISLLILNNICPSLKTKVISFPMLYKGRDDVEPKKSVDSKTKNYIQISKAVIYSEEISTNQMMNSWEIRAFWNSIAEHKFYRVFTFSNNVILCIWINLSRLVKVAKTTMEKTKKI